MNLMITPGNQNQAAISSICFGEVFSPVPNKLMEKIRRGNFVEMHELLPNLWLQAEDRKTSIHSSRLYQVMDVKV